jgi:hypothetical protein
MRKASIVPFALGMVVLTGLFLFGGSVADKILLKNRYFKLKEFTEKAALGAANYYNSDQDITTAQIKTHSLMQSNPLYSSVFQEMEFFWDVEDEVMVRIHHHQFKPFWLRMFGVDVIDIYDVNSSSLIINSDEIISAKTCNFTPITINEQDLEIGQNINLSYQVLESVGTECCQLQNIDEPNEELICTASVYDTCDEGWILSTKFTPSLDWEFDSLDTFYGVDIFASSDNSHGANHIVKWRKVVNGSTATLKDCYQNNISLLDLDSDIRFLGGYLGGDNSLPDEGKQVTDAIKAFEALMQTNETIDIALVDNNATISGYISVKLNSIDAKSNGNLSGRYLNIELEVVQNQNNKKVKLVD